MTTDLIGKKFGDYTLTNVLGRGGMATVYRGYQESIDRSVAVKVLPAEYLNDPHFSKRFTQEARTLSKLTHPAIVPLYAFGEQEGMPYIVMPLMSGGSLADRIKQGALSLSETERIFTRVAEALDFAHRQNILHRDIKPNNILFDQHDNPYLSDFGIAKSTEAASASSMTGTGIVGTPDYMSPEQARGEQVDARADVYALGVVAYQMLTGEVLFKATTPLGVIYKHINEPPPIMRTYRPEIPDNVEAAVFKALEKEPGNRYPTAAEFARALASTIKTPDSTVAPPTARDISSSPTQIESIRPLTPPTAPPKPVEKKSGSTAWVIAITTIVGVSAMCICGLFIIVGLGASSASSTEQAKTSIAIAREEVQGTSTAQRLATSTAVARTSTAIYQSFTATAAVRQTGTAGAVPTANATAAALVRTSSNWNAVLSSDFGSTSQQWVTGTSTGPNNSSATFKVSGGKYQAALKGNAVQWRTGPAMNSLSDFRINADIKRVSGSTSSNYGVYFRRSTTDGMYVFYVNDLQRASMWYYPISGSGVSLFEKTNITSVLAGETNRLTLIAQSAKFTLLVNNQYVGEVSDTRLARGTAGLVMSLVGDDGTFEFDNFEVRVP